MKPLEKWCVDPLCCSTSGCSSSVLSPPLLILFLRPLWTLKNGGNVESLHFLLSGAAVLRLGARKRRRLPRATSGGGREGGSAPRAASINQSA